jgi:hypothetical protein
MRGGIGTALQLRDLCLQLLDTDLIGFMLGDGCNLRVCVDTGRR